MIKKIGKLLEKIFLKEKSNPKIPYFYDDDFIVDEQKIESGRKEREEFEKRRRKGRR